MYTCRVVLTIWRVRCSRLPSSEEQKAVCRQPDAGRPGRFVSQVRAGRGRYRGDGVAVAVSIRSGRGRGVVVAAVQGHFGARGADRRRRDPSAGTGAAVFVAQFAVRVPVRQPIVAVAVPFVAEQHRVATVAAVPPAAAEHRVVDAGRRLRLSGGAAGGRELDRGRRQRRRATLPPPLLVDDDDDGGTTALRTTGAAAHVPARLPQGGGRFRGGVRTGPLRRRVVRPERFQILSAAALPRGTVGRRRRDARRQLRVRGPVRHQARGLLQRGARHGVRAPQQQPVRGTERGAVRPEAAVKAHRRIILGNADA